MSSPGNIGDVGEGRKAAIELEAKVTDSSPADAVPGGSDAGIVKTRSEGDRAAWIASAIEATADEARHLERDGPSLARFRRA